MVFSHQIARTHEFQRALQKVNMVRRVDNRAAESTEKKRYACPYGNGCKARYTERKKLIEHIKKSTAESTSQAHDDAKRDDGWYDEDWEFDVIKAYPKRIRQERRAFGLNYSNEQESDEPKRVRIEAGYEVTLGAGSYMNEIPEEYKRFVFSGSDPERHPFTPGGPVPDVYRGIVFGGDDHNGPSYTPGGPVPAIYRDTVFMGDDPRSRNFRDA